MARFSFEESARRALVLYSAGGEEREMIEAMDEWVEYTHVFVVVRGQGKAQRFRLFFNREEAENVQRTTPGARLMDFQVYPAAGNYELCTSNITGTWLPPKRREP
jgi:hypothetical protein